MSDGQALLKLGVLLSGSGSNLQAILDNIEAGMLDAQVCVVISSRADAYGLKRAEANNIPCVVVPRELYDNPEDADSYIESVLQEHEVDYVVMAGYMRKVTTPLLEAYPTRIINLHPALLPSFKGAHGIKDAFEAGVKLTGVTVHFADEHYDCGPIISQRAVPIQEGMSLNELESAIHDVEHVLLPETLQLVAEGRVNVAADGKVHIAPRSL